MINYEKSILCDLLEKQNGIVSALIDSVYVIYIYYSRALMNEKIVDDTLSTALIFLQKEIKYNSLCSNCPI